MSWLATLARSAPPDGRAKLLGLSTRKIDDVYKHEGTLGVGSFGAVLEVSERANPKARRKRR